MNNALLYVGGLIVVVLAALFAVPTFIDWNGYRGVFEEQAGRVLGRDVQVGGTVNVRFLPAPYVKFEKIRISDAGDPSGEPIFRAESFKLWLAVPPLLRGVFEANEIELKRPVLRLTANEHGGGNWTTLTFAPASLPFVPADVTLEQVRIINGTVVLSGARGQELASVEKVNGELSAETLEGPFKFKGTAKWDGGDRDIRFATARPEPNGDVRFKANVVVPSTKNSYQLEGRVVEIKAKPRIDAELTAKVSIPSVLVGSEDPSSADGSQQKVETPRSSSIDVRGKIAGDAFGMKAQDLTLSLDQAGTPQIVSGQASLDWTNKVKVDLGLGSRWLDLDRAAASGGARPLDVSRGLFEGLTSLLPSEAETNVGLTFDQVNLGAEAVGGVQLTVVRAGGPLELKEFRANVPGGGQLGLDGVLSVGRDAKFEGNLSLDGQSLIRFLTWALKDPTLGEGRSDTPFSISGRMILADKLVALKDARAELGSLPVRGDLKLDLDARRRLTLALEGSKIDVGQLLPGSVGLRALRAFKPSKSAGAADVTVAAAHPHLFDPAKSDMVVNIRAGRLVDGERVLDDVAASLSLDGDKLVTNTLKFSTADGLSVDVAGEVSGVRSSPVGVMRGTIRARSPDSARTFLKLLDLEGDIGGAGPYLSDLAPFDLAGSVSNGVRAEGAIDIKADGTVDGGRFVADIRSKSGTEGWTAEPADVMVSLEGSRAARMIAGLTRAGGSENIYQGSTTPRTLLIKAAGTPHKGMVSLVSLHGEGMALDYSGRITLPKDGAVASTGTLRVAAQDGREALGMFGLPVGAAVSTVPIDGDADLVVEGPAITLTPKRLKIGASSVAGTIKLDRQTGKPMQLTASIDIDRASMPGLLTPLLAAAPERTPNEAAPPPVPAVSPSRRQQSAQAPQQPAPLANAVLAPGLWPDQTFDLAIVDNVEGTIDAKIKALALDEGLTVGDARLQVVFEPHKVRVANLEGSAVGGKLASDMTIEKAPAGVGLSGKLRIGVGEPGPGATENRDSGAPSSLAIEFSGRALSPAALMTDLKGKGEIALGDVTLTGMGPAPVARTVEAALQGKGPAGGQALVDALRASMKQGQLKLGAVKIPVSIVDGAMRLEKVSLETDEGRSTFVTAIELGTMKIDSEWKIEAKIKSKLDETAAKVMLPPVSVVYSGKLKDFVAIEPAIEIGSLERELTVRKMERDVDELERLRKLDQSKAKALEDERAKAAAAAPAPADPSASASSPGDPASDGTEQSITNEPAVAVTNDGTTGAADGGAPADSTATPTDAGSAPVRKYRPPVPKRAPAAPAWKPFQITPY